MRGESGILGSADMCGVCREAREIARLEDEHKQHTARHIALAVDSPTARSAAPRALHTPELWLGGLIVSAHGCGRGQAEPAVEPDEPRRHLALMAECNPCHCCAPGKECDLQK